MLEHARPHLSASSAPLAVRTPWNTPKNLSQLWFWAKTSSPGKSLLPPHVPAWGSSVLRASPELHVCHSDSHLPEQPRSLSCPQVLKLRGQGGPSLPGLVLLSCRLPCTHSVTLAAWPSIPGGRACACPCCPSPCTPPRPWLGQADSHLAPSTRIGLSQLEGFRRQLLDVLQRSTKPKVSSLPSLLPGTWLWAPCLSWALPIPRHKAQWPQPCKASLACGWCPGNLRLPERQHL